MTKLAAALALLLASRRDIAWTPFHEALREADDVAVGTVVEVRTDAQGRRSAVFKPERALKGDCPDPLLLPFVERNPRIGCDFSIIYEKGASYLLFLRPGAPKVAHFQFSKVPSADDPIVKLAEILLDLLAKKNLDRRIPELGRFLEQPGGNRLAYEAVELLTRAEARPLLPAARKYFDTHHRRYASREYLPSHVLVTLDFKVLAEARGSGAPPDGFLKAANRVCGRRFTTVEEFDAWWLVTERRSKADGARPQADALVPDLRSADPQVRRAAAARVLDLGPAALAPILPLVDDADPAARETARTLVDDLRVLEDFRSDFAR